MRRPDVEPHAVADRGVAGGQRFRWRSGLELRGHDVIDRQLESQGARLSSAARRIEVARGVQQVVLDQRLADR